MNAVIVIPTYNEKGNIEKLINILEEEIFPLIKNYKMYIFVADDRSPDGTGEVVEDLIKKYKNLYIIYGEKKGLGTAYLRAMNFAVEKIDADILFEMDADFYHDPKKIPEFLKKIDEGYDFVIGTRYSSGGSIPANWGLHRKIFSIFANIIIRTILVRISIHDWTGGFRAFTKKVFEKEKSHFDKYGGYTFQVAVLYNAVLDGFKIAEVPFHAKDRVLGRSKIAPLDYITNLLEYVFKAKFLEIWNSPFPKYAIVGFSGYLINAISLEIFKNSFGFSAGISASLGAELSTIWNFLLNNYWAFSSQKIISFKALLYKFVQFNFVSFGSLVLVGIFVEISVKSFGDTSFVRQVALFLSIPTLVIPYSYTMYNIFIWKRWHIPFLSKLQKILG